MYVVEGEDALLTCVVRNLESNTLLWKREDSERRSMRILTAGENRVTSDNRFNVLHDAGMLFNRFLFLPQCNTCIFFLSIISVAPISTGIIASGV